MDRTPRIGRAYRLLRGAYGRQHWWPADTPFEVCIGAILTQSTSWANVEKAVLNLKGADALSIEGIMSASPARLGRLIRPSLYYNVKARKLKEFARYLQSVYGGDLSKMQRCRMSGLRKELLGVWGIGPETADSILLYALSKPSFVVDAYTKRIFSRMGLIRSDAPYEEVKGLFESNLPGSVSVYNEYHALIVEHAKRSCMKRPSCKGCCLAKLCAKRI